MLKKVILLFLSAVLMTVLMLAAGGTYLLPESIMGMYMYSGVWDAVGGLFSLMLVPGAAVGYAACQSRVLGIIYYVGFLVLGTVGGVNAWWIVTAVLLVLSYIFCIGENVGIYDELDAYDKLCVLVPAFGALRFIDRFGLEGFFGAIGKVLSILAIILIFALMAALWIVPKDALSAFGAAVTQIKDFAATLFGAVVIFVFIPLFSVYSARYSFIKPGLAKVLSCVFGGYDVMRGAFVTMPILLNAAGGDGAAEEVEGAFGSIFGAEACFLMAMLLGGILCVTTAFGKKLGLAAQFCLTKDGTSSLRCLMMASLSTVLVCSIAPAAIFTVWLAAAAVILIMGTVAVSLYPGYTYQELRSMGYSDYEARKLILITNGSMTAV